MSEDLKSSDQSAEKPAFRIFRAKHAADLSEENMTMSEVSAADMAELAAAQKMGSNNGALAKVLFEDEAAGVSLAYAWFKANYILPRHSHNADCLYYVISGEAHLGTEVLKAGDGFFVPSDALYTYAAGPNGVEVLEFRTAVHFDIKFKTNSAYWGRLAGIVAANTEMWSKQAMPLAMQRIAGAD